MEKNIANEIAENNIVSKAIENMTRNPNMEPLPTNIDINIKNSGSDSIFTISGFINKLFKFIGTFFVILFEKLPKVIWYLIKNSPKVLNSPIFAAIVLLAIGYFIIKTSKKVNDSYANFYMIHESFDSISGELYKKGAETAAKEYKVHMNYLSSMSSSLDKVTYSQTFSKFEKVLETSTIKFHEFMNNFFERFDNSVSLSEINEATASNSIEIYKGFDNALDEKGKILNEFNEIYNILFEQIDAISNIDEVAEVQSIHCVLNTKMFAKNVNFEIKINPINRTMKITEIPDNINKTTDGTIYSTMVTNQKETHWIDPETYAVSIRNPKAFLGIIYYKIKKIINKSLKNLFNELIERFNKGEKIDAILIELSNSEITEYIKDFIKLNKYKKIPYIMSYGLHIGSELEPSNNPSNNISNDNLIKSSGNLLSSDEVLNNSLEQVYNKKTNYLHFVGTHIKNIGTVIGETIVNYFNGTIPELNKALENFKTSTELISTNEKNPAKDSNENNNTFNKAKSILIFIPEMNEQTRDQYIIPIQTRIENEWPGSNVIINDEINLNMQPYEVIGIVSRTLQENSYLSAVISLDPQHNEYIVTTVQKYNPQRIADLPIMVLGMDPFVKVSIDRSDIYASFDFQEVNTGYMAITLAAQLVSGKQFYNRIELNTGPGLHIAKF